MTRSCFWHRVKGMCSLSHAGPAGGLGVTNEGPALLPRLRDETDSGAEKQERLLDAACSNPSRSLREAEGWTQLWGGCWELTSPGSHSF